MWTLGITILLLIVCLLIGQIRSKVIYSDELHAFAIPCTYNLEKMQDKNTVQSDNFVVECPLCQVHNCYIYGTGYYIRHSGICCAAMHDGKVNRTHTFVEVNVHRERRDNYKSSTRHGIKSHRYLPTSAPSFSFTSVTVLPRPSATTNQVLPDTTRATTTTQMQRSDTKPSTANKEAIINASRSVAKHKSSTTSAKQSTEINAVKHAQPKLSSGLATTNLPKSISIPTRSASWLTIGILLSVLVIVLIVGLICFFNRASFSCPRMRYRKESQTKACVCYKGLDSSTKVLLNDPEHCERDCVIRELALGEDENDVGSENLDCNKEDCKFQSKFDF